MRFHEPVLVHEVLEYMNIKENNGVYCDCTVGGGGHLLAMLKTSKGARFVGIDCDPEALAYAQERLRPYGTRCMLCEDNFINIGLILKRFQIEKLDGVLFDLGVSYHQLTTPQRGFSFDRDGALTMRMSPYTITLKEKILSASKQDIIHVLKTYGDVRNNRKIGTVIFEQKHSLQTTFDLRRLVENHIPRRYVMKNLRKIFQALRIWVNDELNNLRHAIISAFGLLRPGGRIVAISYHSGEDRVVKKCFREFRSGDRMKILNKKIVRPSVSEVEQNPQARSARLRAGERCEVC
jgi:16S rRNA (cytosine1402-N4)-methyltransferase